MSSRQQNSYSDPNNNNNNNNSNQNTPYASRSSSSNPQQQQRQRRSSRDFQQSSSSSTNRSGVTNISFSLNNSNNVNNTANNNTNNNNIKARLEQVASQTLFARNKMARDAQTLYDKCVAEAQKLSREYLRFLCNAEDDLLCGLDMIEFSEIEQDRRVEIFEETRIQYRKISKKFEFNFELVSLKEQERVERNELQHHEQQFEFEEIVFYAKQEFEVADLFSKEKYHRHQFESQEFELGNRLVDYLEWICREAQQFSGDCEELSRVYFATRQEITSECASSYRQLMRAHSTRSMLVMEHLEERAKFLDSYHSSLRHLEVAEGHERSELRRLFFDETRELETLLEYNSEQRQRFRNEEATERSKIRAEEIARFTALIDFESQWRDQVENFIQEKETERLSYLEDAFLDLRQIMDQEDSSRERMIQEEQHQRELRRQVIADKRLTRERLYHEARRSFSAIDAEESNERNFIAQRMADNILLVELRLEANEADQMVLEQLEQDTRLQIMNQRVSGLSALHLTMQETETQVLRIVSSRQAQLANTEELETQLRSDLNSHENHQRDWILKEFDRILNQRDQILEAQLREQESFINEARMIINSHIFVEYDNEIEEFEIMFNTEMETAWLNQLDREHNELFDAERKFRNKGSMFELEERKQIQTIFASNLRELIRIEQDQMQHEIHLLSVEEQTERDFVRHEAEEEQGQLSQWCYRNERHARHLEEVRISEEKMERNLQFKEDSRLLFNHDHDDNNSHNQEDLLLLAPPSSSSSNNNNNNVGMFAAAAAASSSSSPTPRARSVENNNNNNGRLSLAEVRRSVSVAPCDGDKALKVNYLSTLLRRNDIADRLNDGQINLLTSLLESSALWRAQKEERAREMENKVRQMEKQKLKAETLEQSRRDTAAYYEKKIEEEQMRFQRTLENEKSLVQRTKKQVKIEEIRVNEMNSMLRKKKEENNKLRDQLHAGMSMK